ncbi:RNA polymerase sigma factor [Tautonia plasticadhaerens]|uniref:RNA polymerase sigma factor n=1 Tax=Tautonia plasticadhaerens TaxID=2527974 RepID=UPI0011A83BDA|nr:sigma-70 family RNA polymerase sigma factor [Tautonia plasticadhaerens]
MPGHRSVAPRGDLDTLFRLGVMGDWPDSRLLDHFASHLDPSGEAAFEALVRRHGPTVWRVCLGLLRDPHAAEDAFQATFLVLARRSGSIRNRDSASAWLCGVARRIALRSRLDASRRRSRERLAARPEAEPEAPRDSHEALLQEVDRLPARYRLPVVLHDLGGCPYDEVARRLGCPIGTVKVRLSRARALLRRRLTRRGLSPSTASPPPALPVPLSAALADRTVRSAVSLGLGRTALDALPPAVSASARWMLNAMILSQLKAAAALVAGTLLLATGAGLVVASQESGTPPPGNTPSPPVAASPAPPVTRSHPWRLPAPPPEEIERRVLEVTADLDDPYDRAEILLSLGRAQLRRGQPVEALDTLRAARLAAEQIPREAQLTGQHPIARIAAAQAEAGDRDAALDTFSKAAEVVSSLDEEGQLRNWGGLMRVWLDSVGRAISAPPPTPMRTSCCVVNNSRRTSSSRSRRWQATSPRRCGSSGNRRRTGEPMAMRIGRTPCSRSLAPSCPMMHRPTRASPRRGTRSSRTPGGPAPGSGISRGLPRSSPASAGSTTPGRPSRSPPLGPTAATCSIWPACSSTWPSGRRPKGAGPGPWTRWMTRSGSSRRSRVRITSSPPSHGRPSCCFPWARWSGPRP